MYKLYKYESVMGAAQHNTTTTLRRNWDDIGSCHYRSADMKGTWIDNGPVTISQKDPRLYHAKPGEPAAQTGTLLRVKQTSLLARLAGGQGPGMAISAPS